MKKIITKPQFFFVILAFILLISGFINKGSSIEIAMSGTFIELKVWSVCLFSTLFFILIAINYTSLTITKKPPKKILTIIHVTLQLLALVPLLYFIYNSNISRTYQEVSQMNVILVLAFMLFIIASAVHLINFIASLLAKKD
tara:strand:+ start:98724 stop:99149 length:426 start_codon:yes stop_codon:yes gene_type:complete